MEKRPTRGPPSFPTASGSRRPYGPSGAVHDEAHHKSDEKDEERDLRDPGESGGEAFNGVADSDWRILVPPEVGDETVEDGGVTDAAGADSIAGSDEGGRLGARERRRRGTLHALALLREGERSRQVGPGAALSFVPFVYFLTELLFGRTIPDLARDWDGLKGWQRGVIGCGIVAAIFAVLMVVLFTVLDVW